MFTDVFWATLPVFYKDKISLIMEVMLKERDLNFKTELKKSLSKSLKAGKMS